MTTGTIAAGDGTRLAYRLDGPAGAPPLLLLNSLGTDLRLWDAQIPRLAERLRVVRSDARGHGRSDAPSGPYTVERLAGDVVALLDRLGIERTHLCGLSLGGLVALRLAAGHPERVDRAVFANTAARIGTAEAWQARIDAVRAGGMAAIREPVLARFLSSPFRHRRPDIARWLGEMLEATPADGYTAACAALRDADLGPLVGTIRAPSLVIAGELDEATPPAQAEALQAAIPGSKLVLFAGTGHLSNLERPDAFGRTILAFLTEPTPAGAAMPNSRGKATAGDDRSR